MNTETISTLLLLSTLFFLLFALAEILYHFFKVKVELTRKFVHIGTGFLTLLFPVMLHNQWFVLLLCTSFGIILIASLRFQFLKSVNAIERESIGSIAYPVSVYGCYLVFDYFNQQYLYFYLPVLILAVCDPLAALIGKKWPMGKYNNGRDNKTLMGSSMFLLSAWIIIFSLFLLSGAELSTVKMISISLFIAIFSCITEAFSRKGYDNLTIPASVLLGLILVYH